ncbi:MAG: acyl-CoA thioesterase [Bacteroidales bacterium]|nr:acyl-CoA thioesterase [Bacteroidales bacterium]
MLVTKTTIRVRYADTDQMGYVYYGKYAEYYEVGRTEMIRGLGLTYADMESEGVIMPVTGMVIKYLKAAKYDEELTVVTTLKELPTARIVFFYDIFNEEDELINQGEVSLVFTDFHKRKPRRPPNNLLQVLQPHFNEPNK